MDMMNVFDVSKLVPVVTLVLALSLASERLVEIVQGLVPPLNQRQDKSTYEGLRRAAIQLVAVAAGIATARLAAPLLVTNFSWQQHIWLVLGLGLLASGGSGLWNSILGYLNGVKQRKECDVEQQRKDVQAQTEPASNRAKKAA